MAVPGRESRIRSGCGRAGALWIEPRQLAVLLLVDDEDDFESDDFGLDDDESDFDEEDEGEESDFEDDESDLLADESDFDDDSDFEPESELAGTAEDFAPSRESLR
jgi:hypothetical protein